MRRLAAALLLSLFAGGCGGARDAREVLDQTAANLGKVRSGTLTLRFGLRPAGRPERGVGVELHGPFSLAARSRLPVARVAYTQVAGSRRVPATLISTGRKAFVAVAGRTYRLAPEQADALRLGDGGPGLQALKLDVRRWVRRPELSTGPRVGGDETDRVTGRLDARAALADLLRAGRRAGADGALGGPDARQVARTVRDARIEILTGSEDRLLRRLRVVADLDAPPGRRGGFGGRAALRLRFGLGVAHPNRSVRVSAPRGAVPLPGTS